MFNKFLSTFHCAKVCKRILLGSLLGLCGAATAGTSVSFVKTGASATDMVPQGYILESESKGDINKDGIEDMVVVLSSGKTYCDSTFTAVYLGMPANEYRLFAVYREGAGCTEMDEGESSFNGDNIHSYRSSFSVEITSKGLISYKENWQFAVGCHTNSTDTWLFRFQNGDLYCIGSESKSICTWGGSAEYGSGNSCNYLTHKKYEYDIEHYSQKNGKWITDANLKPYTRPSLVQPTPDPSKQ
ncbi:MAG: hypothetical protein KBT32_07125 [Bacteroidales bacterium]|nr:hypothetical protein [Candidatus Physcocola equi]